mgnify:FL=1
MIEPVSASADRGEGISSIVIRLKKGRSPIVNGQIRGSEALSPTVRNSLTLGPNLGLRMYRIDLDEPVSQNAAQAIADVLARDPGIAFAEPDAWVGGRVQTTR